MHTDESVFLRCDRCGTRNRVPRMRLKDKPVCGKCRARLPALQIFDRPVVVTDRSFESEVLAHAGPVLVDCWAPWCGPCQMMAPVMDQLARERSGSVKIAKLNVDQNPQTASRYNIMSIPTLLLFSNGRLLHTQAGAQPKAAVEQLLQRVI